MIRCPLRLPLLLALPFALSACVHPAPAEAAPTPLPLGVDLGPSGPPVVGSAEGHASRPGHRAGTAQRVHDGHAQAQGTGTVNSVDAAGHKLNVSHDPIPAIGFPAMTMDFVVAPSVDLSAVKPGSRIKFTVEQGAGGMYEIESIAPAGGGGR